MMFLGHPGYYGSDKFFDDRKLGSVQISSKSNQGFLRTFLIGKSALVLKNLDQGEKHTPWIPSLDHPYFFKNKTRKPGYDGPKFQTP